MTAQRTLARVKDEDVIGRVIVKPELLLELIQAYERMLTAEKELTPTQLAVVDHYVERPFKW